MSRQLKRWESPRREGRNDKGKGGAARKRQLDKRNRMLSQKLKGSSQDSNNNQGKGKDNELFPLLFLDGFRSPNSPSIYQQQKCS